MNNKISLFSVTLFVALLAGCGKQELAHPEVNIEYAKAQLKGHEMYIEGLRKSLNEYNNDYGQKQIGLREAVVVDLQDIIDGYKTEGHGLKAYHQSLDVDGLSDDMKKSHAKFGQTINNLINGDPIR